MWHSSHANRAAGAATARSGAVFGRTGPIVGRVIFKAVGDTRPYPDHGLVSAKDWSNVPPRVVQLGELITTKSTLDLRGLLADDSTFFGDLFPHCVEWEGQLYLEDGLHRALRAALAQRPVLHARVLVLS